MQSSKILDGISYSQALAVTQLNSSSHSIEFPRYNVKFRLADDFTWGKGGGCDFAQRSCFHYMRKQQSRTPRTENSRFRNTIAPYCDARGPVQPSGKFSAIEGGCRREAATPFCNLVKHKNPLPLQYQHLEKGPDGESGERWGAGMWLADFCPTQVTMYTWKCQ